MKILNLYCGIGGNRKLWGDTHEVTAVENNPEIAKIYQDNFPNNKVIIVDAHQYLLEHYNEFDFIWSSPPCPSHSKVRKRTEHQNPPVFPDMQLYEEILFLQGYFKGKWVVENVIGWYKPLIKPQEIGKHYYWASFKIPLVKVKSRSHCDGVKALQKRKGFDLSEYTGIYKEKVLRNCVEPEEGLHVFNAAFNKIQKTLQNT